jgi:DNA-binding beta-propeller fold protein YncE
MKSVCGMTFTVAALFLFASAVNAQDTSQKTPEASNTEPVRPMVLTEAIPLEGVKGRFDHFATSGKMLFVSALGNNTVEVIGISSRTLEHTITGVPSPQGVAYAPEVNKLFVASSKGKLYVYDGTSFDPLTSIDFHGDVDNLRYDTAKKRLYVGYGDEEEAAIGAIDVTTNKRLDEIYKLGAHPESFQLESSGPHIYVNLPDLKQVAVIDRTNGAISRWPLSVEHNFPMALDEADHRLFIGTHEPARLAVIDTNSGQMIAALPSVQDADDLYFDAGRKRVYMAGGEGFVYAFQQKNPDQYQLLAKIPTALGARTAGYFGKGKKNFDRFFLAVPARADHGAEIWIYTVQD